LALDFGSGGEKKLKDAKKEKEGGRTRESM
jgi:hypothetical protein